MYNENNFKRFPINSLLKVIAAVVLLTSVALAATVFQFPQTLNDSQTEAMKKIAAALGLDEPQVEHLGEGETVFVGRPIGSTSNPEQAAAAIEEATDAIQSVAAEVAEASTGGNDPNLPDMWCKVLDGSIKVAWFMTEFGPGGVMGQFVINTSTMGTYAVVAGPTTTSVIFPVEGGHVVAKALNEEGNALFMYARSSYNQTTLGRRSMMTLIDDFANFVKQNAAMNPAMEYSAVYSDFEAAKSNANWRKGLSCS